MLSCRGKLEGEVVCGLRQRARPVTGTCAWWQLVLVVSGSGEGKE
jgi:hypothetical protein